MEIIDNRLDKQSTVNSQTVDSQRFFNIIQESLVKVSHNIFCYSNSLFLGHPAVYFVLKNSLSKAITHIVNFSSLHIEKYI